MAKKTEHVNGKQIIRDELIKLGNQTTSVEDNGELITNAQLLARQIWKYALGRSEVDENGKEKSVSPHPWAILMLCDRIDGKIVTKQIVAGKPRTPLTKKIDDVRKSDLNNLAEDV